MATTKDIFLIVAAAAVGAFAMIAFNQIKEMNHLCRVQMDELKEIANTTEFRRIVNIIKKVSPAELMKYTFVCVVGSITVFMFAWITILHIQDIRRNQRRRRQ